MEQDDDGNLDRHLDRAVTIIGTVSYSLWLSQNYVRPAFHEQLAAFHCETKWWDRYIRDIQQKAR